MVKIYYIYGELDYYIYGYNFTTLMVGFHYIMGDSPTARLDWVLVVL